MGFRRAACVLIGLSVAVCPVFAQAQATPPQTPPATTTPPQTPQTPITSADATAPQGDLSPLPVDLTRIKRVLEKTPGTTRVDEAGLRFYLEIIARHPTFKDMLGNFDLKNGPTPNSAMTYQDFVSMVTPKYYNSSAGFTATDTLQTALVNWAAQSVIKKGINALKNARTKAEIGAINAQIDRELAALRGGG